MRYHGVFVKEGLEGGFLLTINVLDGFGLSVYRQVSPLTAVLSKDSFSKVLFFICWVEGALPAKSLFHGFSSRNNKKRLSQVFSKRLEICFVASHEASRIRISTSYGKIPLTDKARWYTKRICLKGVCPLRVFAFREHSARPYSCRFSFFFLWIFPLSVSHLQQPDTNKLIP